MIFLVVALAAGLVAQAPGSLKGAVLDPSGAAVPGATVTLSGPNGVVKVAQSDNNGAYAMVGLPPGKWTIRVIASGFDLFEGSINDLPGGRASTFDAKMTVASEKQEVTVQDTQTVELDPAKNAGALVLKEADLDMLSDDPDDLQADLLALAGPAAGPNGGQIFIDGFSSGQLPPKDSIREIRINSNPYSAEYDTQGHGRIEIFTKPGSDKYHGSLNAFTAIAFGLRPAGSIVNSEREAVRTTATSPDRASTTKSRWPSAENASAAGPSPTWMCPIRLPSSIE